MSIRVQIEAGTDIAILSQEGGYVDPNGRFRIACFASGVDLGNPDQRTVEVPWSGADGDRLEVLGYENRAQAFTIKVTSLTGTDAGLIAGEAYLAAVVGRPATMTWTSPRSAGTSSAYEWETSSLGFKLDDQDELDQKPRRVFTLVAQARPFARDLEPTVVPAIGSGSGTVPAPTVTVLHTPVAPFTGWSTVDWTTGTEVHHPVQPYVTTTPTGVKSTVGVGSSNFVTLGYEGALSMGTDRWLRVKFTRAGFWPPRQPPVMFVVDDLGRFEALEPTAIFDSYVYYLLPSTVGTTITSLIWIVPRISIGVVWEIARQNVAPVSSSAKQMPRTFPVRGTARTPVSVTVSHTGAAGLGEFLGYIADDAADGNTPGMRRYRASTGTVTGDTASATGTRIDLPANTNEVYEPPASMMPESTYTLLVQERPTSAAGKLWTVTVSTVIGSTVHGTWSSPPIWRDGTPSGVWTITDLGLLTLPSVKVPAGAGTTAKVRVTLSCSASVGIGEVWLPDTIRGRLIRVNAGTAKKIRIDAPTIDSPRTAIYLSDLADVADWSDARHAPQTAIPAVEDLTVQPGLASIFTACAQENAAVSMTYYARALHHIGAPE